MHADQLVIASDQVQALIVDQAPHWVGSEITHLQSTGTVNAIFQIGKTATARFPLLASTTVSAHGRRLTRDAERMSEFLRVSPFPAPKPLLIGRPGHGYPLPWSMQTWLPGDAATPTSHSDCLDLVDDLTQLITELRAADVRCRVFTGSGRGGVLYDHDGWVHESFDRSEGLFDTRVLRQRWKRFREIPPPQQLTMCHTDLIPPNILVGDGRLVGVLDTGDFQASDPALDLVAAWHLFDLRARQRLRAGLKCDAFEWERGKAWALVQAIGLVWYYETSNPSMAHLGRTTLSRIVSDPD